MNSHVCLKISFRGERTTAYFATERPFTGVCPVVHLQSTAATEHTMTDHALVRVTQLVLNVVDQLLQLGCLRRPRHLHESFPRVVVTSRLRQQVLVERGIRMEWHCCVRGRRKRREGAAHE